jgi:hypothetical protein
MMLFGINTSGIHESSIMKMQEICKLQVQLNNYGDAIVHS